MKFISFFSATIFFSLLVSLLASGTAHADVMTCSDQKGWVLSAETSGAYSLKNVSLQNDLDLDRGGVTDRAESDPHYWRGRFFTLSSDPFCDFEVILPTHFPRLLRFQVSLKQRCSAFEEDFILICQIAVR